MTSVNLLGKLSPHCTDPSFPQMVTTPCSWRSFFFDQSTDRTGDCRTYAKMLYQAKDTKADPFADDLASLGLDVLVAEAGWSRHAPNPLLLVGG